ncbi:cytochrome B [Gammaproteobacteria bacterium 45_16_T64]|nr:cytochrome B [Gammaproteobacteria bacterium 45_16_T64]
MKLTNQPRNYGIISILLHWSMALIIVGLFALGLWMTSLSYYDPWYRQGPWIHKSIGLLLAALFAFRWIWRISNITPQPSDSLKPIEKKLAHGAHLAFYGLIATTLMSGYLISTADGRAIEVFNWFHIPAMGVAFEDQEDIAGDIHYYVAFTLIGLAAFHGLAAIKHHVIDKDNTLRSMTFPKH